MTFKMTPEQIQQDRIVSSYLRAQAALRDAASAISGEVIQGVRCGLPDHIDGIPVRPTVSVLTLPRWYSIMGRPLPMMELRKDDDTCGSAMARWPDPFPEHRLEKTDA